MEWVNVEDRLPPNDINVIACGKRRKQYHDGLGDFTENFIGEVKHIDDGCFIKGLNVEILATHWMPLPEPPE